MEYWNIGILISTISLPKHFLFKTHYSTIPPFHPSMRGVTHAQKD
jgi:hypothetical protein